MTTLPVQTYEDGELVAEEEVEIPQESVNADLIDKAITAALAGLRALVDAPALPAVPSGTMTTAQLSNALRILRDEAQATRAGAQRVAATLTQTIRLIRGDFDGID